VSILPWQVDMCWGQFYPRVSLWLDVVQGLQLSYLLMLHSSAGDIWREIEGKSDIHRIRSTVKFHL